MVVTREELKLQAPEQDTLVERSEVEKKVLFNTVRQEGFELGVRSSSKLSYKEFRHFERVSGLANSLDEDVLEYLWSFLDGKEYPQDARLYDADFAALLKVDPASRVVFAQGWMDGVLSVWKTIKEQTEATQ